MRCRQGGHRCAARAARSRSLEIGERVERGLRIARAGEGAGKIARRMAQAQRFASSSGSSRRRKARQRFMARRKLWIALASESSIERALRQHVAPDRDQRRSDLLSGLRLGSSVIAPDVTG